jgi:uncharacterized protein YbjT (DUF2867 family)
MVGQGVLRECLQDDGAERVLVVTRTPTGVSHAKLRELVRTDLSDLTPVEAELAGYDACFYCVGVSSVGMSEADYTRVTHDLTLAAAVPLARLNPGMTFVFVSGTGTDSTEQGRVMWARVKGKAENAIGRLPFKASFMFRPGVIQPLHGVRSKTRLYRVAYLLAAPLMPLLRAVLRDKVTTSELVGRAMLEVARNGAPKRLLENADINALGA